MNCNKDQNCIRILADEDQISQCKNKIDKVAPKLSDLASIIGLIGNDTRIKILYLIKIEKKLCVCDLSDILGITVPAVSQQLRKLKDRGIIRNQREGTVIYYSLSDRYIQMITEVLGFKKFIE